MRRCGRWLRRLMVAALVIFIGAVVAITLLLPVVAEGQTRKALERVDVDVAFELGRATLRGIDLGSVALGSPPWLTADRVVVRYRPLQVVRGRLDSVTLEGVIWRVGARAGEWDVGLRPRAGGGGGAGADLPLESLVVRDGTVIVDAAGATIRVPIQASAHARDDRCMLELHTAGPVSFEAASVQASTVSLKATVAAHWNPARAPVGGKIAVESTARLEFAGASLTWPEEDIALEGIDGTIAFESVLPPSTRRSQALTIASGRVGQIGFADVTILFTLEGPDDLLLHEARWTMDDHSRMTASSFHCDPQHPRIDTTIHVEDLSLAYWLPLLSHGRATGEGTLSGHVPISLRPGDLRSLALGEGLLVAPSGGGTITTSDADRLAALLEGSDERFRSDQTMQAVKERLVEALGDFQYDELRLELVDDPQGTGGTLLRAFTRGKGRRGDPPQEIGGLTLNISGVDLLLASLLSYRAAIERAADDGLEQFFDE